ncbi:Fe2+ transport system protein FeoA [Acholeplasma morum]|uniref:FeoA family protein n=1 Tax=Paracholeplasma morum TaxID=264637 RepID=UPI00195823A6|nr:FeoA family protein [Paracholeplasma morum]MBM7453527.1 Fe2+ transport system protein FeoA [Paracholeplasma morum]
MTETTTTLDKVKLNQSAKVIGLNSTKKEIKRRLLDMGLTPGVIVHIKKIAPLGDPVDISIRDYNLCIRKEDLKQIEVIIL